MQVQAKSKYVRISPHKLRPIIDVIRDKSLAQSKAYLKTHMTKRIMPIIKVLDSAYANAKNSNNEGIAPEDFVIKKIFVDEGPVFKYYIPAAMGRAAMQRKRLSHITVILEKIAER